MKNIVFKNNILFFLLIGYKTLLAQPNVTFSIQAHQDDWQLFMSSNIINDVSDKNNKVVFITFTAGDAGHGDTSFDDGTIPYFLAREQGSVYSSKFIADLNDLNPKSVPCLKKNIVTYKIPEKDSFVQHKIATYRYKNTVNYFLRLPDGNRHGEGFKTTQKQSLELFKDGKIKTMSAVDASTTYQDWNDLVQTVKQIILNEREDDEQIWLNCASLNNRKNRKDHSDHKHCSMAAREAIQDFNWVGVASWLDYNSRKKRKNLSERMFQSSTAAFTMYNWALLENHYPNNFDSGHLWWLARDYFTTVLPTGNFSDTKQSKIDSISTKIPIISTCTNPNHIGKDILFSIEIIEKGQLKTELINMNGQVLEAKDFYFEEGKNNFSFPTNGLSAGSYRIRLILNNKYIQSQKVILVN